MKYILNRLKERSTWLGIITLATAFGAGVSPELANGIIEVGVGLASAIAIFTKG